MRINLIITSYSGRYNRKFSDSNNSEKDKYLRYNMYLLNKIKTNISQITIMKPKVNDEHETIKDYYNIDNLDLDKIKDKIKIYDCENIGISYGQFIKAIEIDNTFDYYIFVEDDYIPCKDYFENDLIDELNKNDISSFLCLTIYKNKKWNVLDILNINFSSQVKELKEKFNLYNTSINSCCVPDFSIGILSKHTVNKLLKTYLTLNNIYSLFKVNLEAIYLYQVLFGHIFNSANTEIHDLSDKYLSVFHESSNKKIFFTNNNIYNKEFPLFLPMEIFDPENKLFLDEMKNCLTYDKFKFFMNYFIKLKVTKKKYNIYYE
jgi:hypothetical protein